MSEHRNILLLIADDLGKYLGAYGCSSVSTENIDKLAREGVRFSNAFASTASCSGSRSTIYTGLHTHENGQYGLNIFRTHFQTFQHVETLPALLNSAGYLTGIIGKVHVGPDETYSWTHRVESESRDVAWVADEAAKFFDAAKRQDKPFCLTVGYVDPHRDVTTRGGFGNDRQYDSRLTPIDVRPEDVEVPSWLTDLPGTRAELVEYYKAIHRFDQGIGIHLSSTHLQYETCIVLVRRVRADSLLPPSRTAGLALDALATAGAADNTLVFLLSDNGPPFINAKTTLFDAGTCLPLIVRAPGTGTRSQVNPNMVSFIDILPTCLDWARLPLTYSTRPDLQREHAELGGGHAKANLASPPRLGRSILPVLHETSIVPEERWSQLVYGSHTFHELHNYWPTRVVRTPRFKYHRNLAWRLDFPFAGDLYASRSYEGMRNATPARIGRRAMRDYIFRPPEELFDVEADPDEITNLAEDPKFGEVVREMRRLLETWQLETRDLWLYRDGQSMRAIARYEREGLRVPNRFDVNVDDPSSQYCETVGVGQAFSDGLYDCRNVKPL